MLSILFDYIKIAKRFDKVNSNSIFVLELYFYYD